MKIESALDANRVKYEKELEETRRSYRVSMNELRTITSKEQRAECLFLFHRRPLSLVAQQVQEMHNSLELQYWTRLADMRHRYESTVPPPYVKASKPVNGAPR